MKSGLGTRLNLRSDTAFHKQKSGELQSGKDKAVDQKIKEQLDKIRASYATDEQKVELEKKKSVESRKGGKAPLQA